MKTNKFADYKLIMDHFYNMPHNIFITNETGHIHWVNKKLLTFFNASDFASIKGLHVSVFGNVIWDNLQKTIASKSEITIEEEYNGHHFLTTRKPLIQNHSVVGILGISIDITEKKAAEIEKAEFLRNIRHDIRTPLSGIVGSAQLLKVYTEESEIHSLVDNIAVSSETLLHILDKIFAFTELSPTHPKKNINIFSLRTLLESMLNLHQSKADEKKLSLLFEYDSKLPKAIIAKEMDIQSLIWELLSNALKYTETGYIKIKAQYSPDSKNRHLLELSVEDTGIGISPKYHKKIFDPFTQVSSAWTRKEQGQGIGLANVQKLSKLLDAEIKLDSMPGKGSRFSCLIPFKPAT